MKPYRYKCGHTHDGKLVPLFCPYCKVLEDMIDAMNSADAAITRSIGNWDGGRRT